MSETFVLIQALVASGEVRVSEHGYDELAEDGLSVSEILAGVSTGAVVEDYPDYPKGRSVLVLQWTAPVGLFTTLQASGAVSAATAREMAGGALRHSDAHIALAVTGIAGPGGGNAS